MIKIYITGRATGEDVVKYPSGTEYNFTENGEWLGIFDENKKLLATIASRYILRIEAVVEPVKQSVKQSV